MTALNEIAAAIFVASNQHLESDKNMSITDKIINIDGILSMTEARFNLAIREAVEAERKRCAEISDNIDMQRVGSGSVTAMNIAAAIRAEKETTNE